MSIKNLTEKIFPIGSLRRTAFQFFIVFPQIIKQYSLRSIIFYFKRYGIKGFFQKLAAKVGGSSLSLNTDRLYKLWIERKEPKEEELLKHKNEVFNNSPLISIIVPVYETPLYLLKEMITSVINQTYSNWELCIAEGGSKRQYLKEALKKYADDDKRIKVVFLDNNLGIALNSNEAIKLAGGDYISFLDHDDTLAPFALYEVVKAINENPDLDFIYSDEDNITENGKKRFNPHFKPDFSPDLLRSYNYITHFSIVKKGIIKEIGYFREGFEGSQDYDLILRITEKAHKIIHIPKILYHWRVSRASAASNSFAKPYTDESSKKALLEHLERIGLKGNVENIPLTSNIYRIRYESNDKRLVSIVIPNKDSAQVLNKCIASITTRSTYKNIEIIIVENNSKQNSTFELYNKLSSNKNIRIVEWHGEFNYSKVNNFGVNFSNGELLLFLNNDTEVITPAWLNEMTSYFLRKEVGIVGAKLYFGDGLIQHAGDIIGLYNVAGHSHSRFHKDASGYFNRLKVVQNLSAVTGACLMTSRIVFDEVNGFDEAYPLAFSDVDYCLKVRQKNYLIIFTPNAELYHHESISRGHENTKEKQERFLKEANLFRGKWKEIIATGDPYYSPNLTLDKEDFSIGVVKLLPKVKTKI